LPGFSGGGIETDGSRLGGAVRFLVGIALVVAGASLLSPAQAWDDRPEPSGKSPPDAFTLRNPSLLASVFLPDSDGGFYTGHRFEAGIVGDVESMGTVFVGPDTSGSLGLCAEFPDPIPLPGQPERFVRIGQGIFENPEGKSDPRSARLLERPEWEIVRSENVVTLRQQIQTPEGVGCLLRKDIRLVGDDPVIEIRWHLTNTGTHPIRTRHYSHNWLRPGGKTISPDLVCEFPFDFLEKVTEFSGKNGFRMRPRAVTFVPVENLRPSSASFLAAGPFDGPNTATLRDQVTGARIEIENDWTPFDIAVYVDQRGFCPESFLAISLPPGQSKTWSTSYRFHAPPANNPHSRTRISPPP
jgi:hypothetical protein